MSAARSYLYVPGDRPERLAKAFTRYADHLIVDLEDAVALDAKDRALRSVLEWLDVVPPRHAPLWIRVNCGERGREEIRQLAVHPAIDGFCLPKTETAAEVEEVDLLLSETIGRGRREVGLAPLLESATSIVNVHSIAAAPRVRMLHIGEIDLAADLGITVGPTSDELLYVRSLVVIASRHAKLLAPPAPVSAQIDDEEAFRESTSQLKALGFVGRACIHPRQVAVVNDVFTPTSDEIAWAKGIIDVAAESAGAFRGHDGTMVDEAVIHRARKITSH